MGLEKEIDYGNIPCSYLKIKDVNLDFQNKNATIILNAYTSREQSLGGGFYVTQKHIQTNGAMTTDEEKKLNRFDMFLNTSGTDIREIAYKCVKTFEEFADAEIILEDGQVLSEDI